MLKMEHKDTTKQTKMSADRALVEANIQGGLILDAASRSGAIPKNINHPPAKPLNKDPTLTLNLGESGDAQGSTSQDNGNTGLFQLDQLLVDNRTKDTSSPNAPINSGSRGTTPSLSSVTSRGPSLFAETPRHAASQALEPKTFFISDSPMPSTTNDQSSSDVALDMLNNQLREAEDEVVYYEMHYDQVEDYEISYLVYEADCISKLNTIRDMASKLKQQDSLDLCTKMIRRVRAATQAWNMKIGEEYTRELELQTSSIADSQSLPADQEQMILNPDTEADTTVDKLNYRHKYTNQPTVRGRAPSISEELAEAEKSAQSTSDQQVHDPNLTLYDRSAGTMPPLRTIIENIRTNQPDVYSKLSRNEKLLIKKFSQMEERIEDCETNSISTTNSLEAVRTNVTSNSNLIAELESDSENHRTQIDQVGEMVVDLPSLSSYDTLNSRIESSIKSTESLAGIVSNSSAAINNHTSELRDIKVQLNNIRVTLKLQARQIAAVSSSKNGLPFTPSNSPGLDSAEKQETMKRVVTSSPENANFHSKGHHAPIGITSSLPSKGQGSQAQDRERSQPHHQFSREAQPFFPARPELPVTAPLQMGHHNDSFIARSSPQNSPYRRSAVSRSIKSPDDPVTRDLHRSSFLMLVDKLEGMILDKIDASTPLEYLSQYATVIPTIEKVSKQCNEALMKYSEWPDYDGTLCKRAIDVMRAATSWVHNVRVHSKEKDSHSIPLGKEYKEDLVPFNNSAKQNVFDFFKLFEKYFKRKGTEEERCELLVNKYLPPRIALQVSEFNMDYKAVKDFLLKRYGDPMTITNAILDDLEGNRKPSANASYKQSSDFLTKILAGIYKVKNLSQTKGIALSELALHCHSRVFTHRLVNLLPDSYRLLFNGIILQNSMDPMRLQGKEVTDLLTTFLNESIQSLDTFASTPMCPTSPTHKTKISKKSVNVCLSPGPSSPNHSISDELESAHAAAPQPSSSRAKKDSSQLQNKTANKPIFKFPCPIEDHKHEVGSCSEYFKLTATERYDTIRGRQCFTCLGPRYRCKTFCGNSKKIPSELLCQECSAGTQKGKKVLNILLCKDDTHTKPSPKDVSDSLKKWFPEFNTTARLELSANAILPCYLQSCNQCGQADDCSCNLISKSSPFDRFSKVPLVDTCTGNDIPIADNDIVSEVDEATLFTMQWLKIRGVDFLTFYDSGASQHLIKGSMAEDANLKVITTRPSTLRVVGGGKVSSEYGSYKIGLGRTINGKVHEIVCQGMADITSDFPKCDLGPINDELKGYKKGNPVSRESLPKEIGGTEVHMIIGLKDPALHPQLIFSLPSGIGVYRSKLTDKFGSTLCYGGPHSAFSNAYKATHGTVNYLMALFVNSYRMSIYNTLAPFTTHLEDEFEHALPTVLVKHSKGTSYSIPTDDELGCHVHPTPLTIRDFTESGCLVKDATSNHLDDYEASSSQLTSSDTQGPIHHCWVLKASIPLARLKQLMEDPEEDTITYRCPNCARCIQCKKSSKIKAISIRERFEQEIIQKSVVIDTEKQMVRVDMPFTRDPIDFLSDRHKGSNNRYQALQVYKSMCKKNTTIKDGIRLAQSDLVARGFMASIGSLNPKQQSIIADANFQHFFPWRCAYKEDSISTPVRIVVDPTFSGLNLILAKGENRIEQISSILLRSRFKRYIWSSDISKLYNQLKLNDSSLPYSLFLYDQSLDPATPPSAWVMTSAWYGTGSSGGQAEWALEMLANNHAEEYPDAVEPLTRDRYVDDLSPGANDEETRERQISQTTQVLQQGGLSLKYIVKSGEPPPPEASLDGKSLKLLGHKWDPQLDTYSPGFTELNFNKKVRGVKKPNTSKIETHQDAVNLMEDIKLTRTSVVAKVAELFDPMGLWEPLKLQLKLDLSILNGMDWKAPLDDSLQAEWKDKLLQFTELDQMSVPRCVIPTGLTTTSKVRLLCISDAAVHAGGAAIYVCFPTPDDQYTCSLLCSKSRLLDGTVPRNELSAVMLMTELAYFAKKSIGESIEDIIYVTDSTIALCWVSNTSKRLKQYVLNRVMLIRQMIEWTTGIKENLPLYHIDGTLNPADLLTKSHDIKPSDLGANSMWQSGMDWMRLPFHKMPLKSYNDIQIDAKAMQEVDQECFQEPNLSSSFFCDSDLIANTSLHPAIHPFEGGRGVEHLSVNIIFYGWQKGINILAKVHQFCQNMIHSTHQPSSSSKEETKSALKSICKKCSSENKNLDTLYLHLAEYTLLREDTNVTIQAIKPAKLKQFHHADGIIWYSGRLREMSTFKTADLDIDSFFDSIEIKGMLPIITSASPLFYAYLMHIHMKLRPHSGVEVTMKEISKKFFVLYNARKIIEKVRKSCTMCRRILKKTMQLEMAKHHDARTTIAPPFYNCMADIAYGFRGKPYYGARKECKVYALVIVCVLSSATSILALEGLQTQNVIQALERHASRHGVPNRIFVDNGTQLISLQNTEFSLSDIHCHVHDSMGMTIEVSTAKSHESRGRVEAKVKILRSMLNKMAINSSTSMTALQWETCFSKIANHIDDLPIARGSVSIQSDIGWDIITPNRLKLGRNNNRSLSGPISITAGSGYDNLLALNRKAQTTWYQMFLDRLHHLIPRPNKWLKSDTPNVGDIVLFIYLDGQRSKEQAVWVLGKVSKVASNGRKITIKYPERNSRKKIPDTKEIVRSNREVSIIFSVDDIPLNTYEHFQALMPTGDKNHNLPTGDSIATDSS